jgi:hypothetical protein
LVDLLKLLVDLQKVVSDSRFYDVQSYPEVLTSDASIKGRGDNLKKIPISKSHQHFRIKEQFHTLQKEGYLMK